MMLLKGWSCDIMTGLADAIPSKASTVDMRSPSRPGLSRVDSSIFGEGGEAKPLAVKLADPAGRESLNLPC